MTPQLITYAILGIASTAVLMVGYPLVPSLLAKLPTRKARDNRAELAAALRLIADHVAKLTDKKQVEHGTSAVIDLAPLILVRAA